MRQCFEAQKAFSSFDIDVHLARAGCYSLGRKFSEPQTGIGFREKCLAD